MIKAGPTQTQTSLLKQYVAGERVDLLDDYDFPARTITETGESPSNQPIRGQLFLVNARQFPEWSSSIATCRVRSIDIECRKGLVRGQLGFGSERQAVFILPNNGLAGFPKVLQISFTSH